VGEEGLFLRDFSLALVDALNDIVSGLAVDGTADALGRAEDFLDGTGQVLGQGFEAHLACNLNDLIQRHVPRVLDVLLLLPVSWRLFESLDDQGRGGWDHGDGSLTVLDSELNGDTKTFPVSSGLGDIFTDLLGGETKRTDLGG